jgi:hypothetical protein
MPRGSQHTGQLCGLLRGCSPSIMVEFKNVLEVENVLAGR